MTEQNKSAGAPSFAPQRPTQQPQQRGPIRPATRPQSSVPHTQMTGQVPPQGQRRALQTQPARRMAPAPQGSTARQMPHGMQHPPRQGQMPPQRRVVPQNTPQRPMQSQYQQPVTQQQRPVTQQNQEIPSNIPQGPQLSAMQSLLLNPRNLAFLLIGMLIFGILLGAMMFGGSSQPVSKGLQNVVRNKDIRQQLPLCGRIDKGQPCVLYIMNATRYDQMAENFFNEALKLTEVPLRSISWANPKYAKQRIPPGAFAEIFIPKTR